MKKEVSTENLVEEINSLISSGKTIVKIEHAERDGKGPGLVDVFNIIEWK